MLLSLLMTSTACKTSLSPAQKQLRVFQYMPCYHHATAFFEDCAAMANALRSHAERHRARTRMPRQNTSPSEFPPAILQQISQLAAGIVAARKRQGATQAQWAAQLGISQPTMARLERGDPSVSAATYVMCLWLINPDLDMTVLLEPQQPSSADPVPTPKPAALQSKAGKDMPTIAGAADELLSLLKSFAPVK